MKQHRTQRGFTLIEVMIAASIFAIGLIAVAAIFPTAIQLQKQTFEAIRADEFARSAKQLILARGFDERSIADVAENGGVIPLVPGPPPREPPTVFSSGFAVGFRGHPFPPTPGTPAPGWSLRDRSGGSLDSTRYTDGNGVTVDPATAPFPSHFDYAGRNLFWTPVFIDYNDRPASDSGPAQFLDEDGINEDRSTDEDALDNRKWGVFVFVTRSEPKANYLRPVSGNISAYATDLTIDLPQDSTLDTIPDDLDPLVDDYSRIPGIAQIDVTVPAVTGFPAPRHFAFINSVNGVISDNAPIVRVGDEVLARDGTVYEVESLVLPLEFPSMPDGGVRIRGVISERPADPIVNIWAAHPGTSGQTSFTKLIQLVAGPDSQNLIR